MQKVPSVVDKSILNSGLSALLRKGKSGDKLSINPTAIERRVELAPRSLSVVLSYISTYTREEKI